MAENNKDHLADALAAFAAGHHDEPDSHRDEAYVEPPATPAPRPAAPRPVAGVRPPAPGVTASPRPSAPAPVAKARPTIPGAPARPTMPAVSPRPSVPAAAPVTPRATAPVAAPRTSRPQAPAAPPAVQFVDTAAAMEPGDESSAGDQGQEWAGTVPRDDDAMLAPAPDASQFTRRPTPSKSSKSQLAAGVAFKQTLIPILLTTGVLLIVFGSLKFIMGPESPFAALPGWTLGVMFGFGTLMLAFGVFNMLQVKDQLARTTAK